MDLERFKMLYGRFSKLPLDRSEWETKDYYDYNTALIESKECSDWYLMQEMDKKGFDYSKYCCLEIAKHISDGISENVEIIYDNVDIILRKWNNGTIGIPIHDGGSSMIEIKYCPFCGTKL
jgi:hypothetical protein